MTSAQFSGDLFTWENAKSLLRQTHWHRPLTVALAFTFQRRIMHLYGDGRYKTSFQAHDAHRPGLLLPPLGTTLDISRRSLCHPSYFGNHSKWMVYHGTGRIPNVKSATPLPGYVAGWFTHLQVSWNEPDITSENFSKAFALAMNSDQKSLLKKFASILRTSDGVDTMDTKNEESAASEENAEFDLDQLAKEDASRALSSDQTDEEHTDKLACVDDQFRTQEVEEHIVQHEAWHVQSELLNQIRGILAQRWRQKYSNSYDAQRMRNNNQERDDDVLDCDAQQMQNNNQEHDDDVLEEAVFETPTGEDLLDVVQRFEQTHTEVTSDVMRWLQGTQNARRQDCVSIVKHTAEDLKYHTVDQNRYVLFLFTRHSRCD